MIGTRRPSWTLCCDQNISIPVAFSVLGERNCPTRRESGCDASGTTSLHTHRSLRQSTTLYCHVERGNSKLSTCIVSFRHLCGLVIQSTHPKQGGCRLDFPSKPPMDCHCMAIHPPVLPTQQNAQKVQ